MTHETLPTKYPSTDLAYPIAISSYDWAVRRFDAMDAKMQTILSVGISITVAAPVAFSALKLSANKPFMVAAVVLFLVAAGVGIVSRLSGDLKIITPKTLHQKWLHLSEENFKKDMIYHAGEHLQRNVMQIEYKYRGVVAVSTIFALESFCLFAAAFLAVPIP